METNNQYLYEIYEAITKLTDQSVKYSCIKAIGKDLDEEENKSVINLINDLRYYENHAFIRLSALKEKEKISLNEIEELRKNLVNPVPKTEIVSKLVIEYQKIIAEKIAGNILVTTNDQVSGLTK